MEDRGSIEKNVKAVINCIKNCSDIDVIALPEFFAYPLGFFKEMTENFGKNAAKRMYEESNWIFNELKEVSYNAAILIAGSLIEKHKDKYYNTCYVLNKGEVIAKYRKINIIDEEIKAGISPGNKIVSFKIHSTRAGIMICADCLKDSIVKKVCENSEIVFLPISMTSPEHPTVEGHPLSIKAAKKYGVKIVKISKTAVYSGKKFGVKSAVITPKGVLSEAESVDECVLKVSL